MFQSTWSRSERLVVTVEMSLRYFASMNQTQVWLSIATSISDLPSSPPVRRAGGGATDRHSDTTVPSTGGGASGSPRRARSGSQTAGSICRSDRKTFHVTASSLFPARGPDGVEGLAPGRTFVTRQVVHDDDVAGPERRHEDLFEVREEARAIDRPIEHCGRGQTRDPERGEERGGVPTAVGGVGDHALAALPTGRAPDKVRPDPTVIEKHQAVGIQRGRGHLPRRPDQRHISPGVLSRVHRFFLRWTPSLVLSNTDNVKSEATG